MNHFSPWLLFGALIFALSGGVAARGDEPPTAPAEEGLTRLSPHYEIWADKEQKRVLVVAEVCLREGPLELFACLKRTKEHEAILSARTKAYLVHAGLIAIGAVPGNTARWVPKYTPASGTAVDVILYWTDAQGKRQQAKAQDWVRSITTNKPMAHGWVFGGSGFWVDKETGQRYYQAEEGDFICVSNFPTAMLDLPIESSQSNDALAFEALTERIPPLKTRVTIALVPRLKDLPVERGADPRLDLLPPTDPPQRPEPQ